MKRLPLIISLLLSSAIGFAQPEIVTPKTVVEGKGELLYTYKNEQAVPAANLLDMVYECNRAAGLVMDVDGDGAEDFRIYGFDYVNS